MWNSLQAFSRHVDRISTWAGRFASLVVLVATLLCVANALLRYGLNIGSNAWIEAQSVMFGAMVYFGGAQTLRMNQHIRIDIIYSGRKERTRLLIDLFGTLFLLLPYTVLMTWLSWRMFAYAYLGGEVSNNAGGLPIWPAMASIPLGLALLTLQGVSEAIKRAAALRGQLALDVSYEKPQQ